MKLTKTIIASTLALTTFMSNAFVTSDLHSDKVAKRKDHWTQLVGFYSFKDELMHRSSIEYVKKQYCIEASLDTWKNFYDTHQDMEYKLIVICRKSNDHYKSVEIKCDQNMSCNV